MANGKIAVVNDSVSNYHSDALIIPADQGLTFHKGRLHTYIWMRGGLKYSTELLDAARSSPEGTFVSPLVYSLIFSDSERVAHEFSKRNGGSWFLGDFECKVPMGSAHLGYKGIFPVKNVIHSVMATPNGDCSNFTIGQREMAQGIESALEVCEANYLKSAHFILPDSKFYDSPLEEVVSIIGQKASRHFEKNGNQFEKFSFVMPNSRDFYRIKRFLERQKLNAEIITEGELPTETSQDPVWIHKDTLPCPKAKCTPFIYAKRY